MLRLVVKFVPKRVWKIVCIDPNLFLFGEYCVHKGVISGGFIMVDVSFVCFDLASTSVVVAIELIIPR